MVKIKTNSLYHRPKQSSNKIRILQTKFEFGKKNEFNIPNEDFKPHSDQFWYPNHYVTEPPSHKDT